MDPRRPSDRLARAALFGAVSFLPSDVLFLVLLAYRRTAGTAYERYTDDWWQVAVLALSLFLSGMIARFAAPVAYLSWLHRAYGNALALASAGERGGLTPRAAVAASIVPVVQLATGLHVAHRLDALSRATSGAPAWWISVWWLATVGAAWTDVVALGTLPLRQAGTTGWLVVAALVLRWIAIPLTVLFVRRIERLQRERARDREWADVF